MQSVVAHLFPYVFFGDLCKTVLALTAAVQITLTRDALEHIAALNHPLRRVVGARLSNLADGNWRLQQQQQLAVPLPASTVHHDLAARAAERRQLHSSAYGSQDSFQVCWG